MGAFARLFQDFRKGENIDLYLTIVVAIALATLNLLGIVPVTSLTALVLALLGLLFVAQLGTRHKLEELHDLVVIASGQAQPFLEEFPPDFGARLAAARELWLTGTHHSAALTAYYQILEDKVRSGGTLRVLLVDPNGPASKMAAMRFAGTVDADHERVRIRASLETLGTLRAVAPGRVLIRVIDFPVDYTAYVLDPDSSNGMIYVERSTFKTSGGARKPKSVYRRRDARWFEHLRAEVGHLWDSGKDWPPGRPDDEARARDALDR